METNLERWLRSSGVSKAALARECARVDPTTEIPRPHISLYGSGALRPTAKKAAIISAATFSITPNSGVSVAELLYPDGLPQGAVMSRDEDASEDDATGEQGDPTEQDSVKGQEAA